MRKLAVWVMLGVVLFLFGASLVEAQDPPRIRCRWDRPETGSPVQTYELHVKDVDGGLDTVFTVPAQSGQEQVYEFDGTFLRRYVARVRGQDALLRWGPWSNFSPIADFEEDEPEP